MELTILGSGTGEPSLKRGFPGILVRLAERIVVVDSGSGTLRALLAEGVTYRDIDEMWYTHMHCDHVSELAPILFAMKNMAAPRERDLRIVAPRGFSRFYEDLLRLYGSTLDPSGYRVFVEEVEEAVVERPGWILMSLAMSHTQSSVGYRVESGETRVAFSGDTGYCANLSLLARDTDLFVCECSFPDGMEVEGHLTPGMAGAAAARANCKRLLLTHLYPVCDSFDILGQCMKAFHGEVIIANDGMKIEA